MSGPKKLGILGGGQLARMLAESARELGAPPVIFCGSAQEPAAQAGFEFESDSEAFTASIDLGVFENEFIDANFWRQKNLSTCPKLEVIELLSNKLEQKKLLDHLRIPTATYEVFDPSSLSIQSWIERCFERLPNGPVFKWAKFGYDGNGTFISKPDSSRSDIEGFCHKGLSTGVSIYAEQKIEFEKELAMLCVRGEDSSFVNYPLVISHQDDGICKQVRGPAVNFGVSLSFQEASKKHMRSFAEHLDLQGAFAFEYFLRDDKILVNEIAPRVHNTAHYSQHASSVSQFENHIRACLGMKLLEPKSSKYFGMLNLLGPSVESKDIKLPIGFSIPQDLHLYWYEKSEVRPRRKMGHINYFSDEASEFNELENLALAFEKSFWDRRGVR